ncbi:uncharacterized protein LOC135814641 [Sycon ciliatum]|uniref:uncharacterized protein LOC135814641 n=1 Tax=Sycon ciliatum TaxID=27933 RepID=UPI0031F69032
MKACHGVLVSITSTCSSFRRVFIAELLPCGVWLQEMSTTILPILLLVSCFLNGHGYDDVKFLTPDELTQYVVDHRLVAVFVYSGSCDKQCAEHRQLASEAWLQSTDYIDDLVFVQSDVSVPRTGPWFDDKQPLPSLLFYRDALPIVYAGEWGVDTISMWLSDSLESAVQELTDETFEHDTQAATGATTGDWMVLFMSNDYVSCPLCSARHTSLHTAASRLRSRFVFGVVNLDTSPKLRERFRTESGPELYFFRKGQMYRFTVDSQSTQPVSKQLEAFMSSGFEKVDERKVTLEPISKGSGISIVDRLVPILGILAAIAVPFFIAGAVLERIAKRQKKAAKAKSRGSDSSSVKDSGSSARQRKV